MQLFPRSFNFIAKASILLGVLFVAGVLVLGGVLTRSSYYTRVGVPREQKVPFSHKHHVGGLGIDCRFCHSSVEDSPFAGIPPTQTCMKCHSEIWKDSPMLAPVHESMKTGKSLEWIRVHDLPDYVYFNHSIHVSKGFACVTCHGQVDQMPLMYKKNTLHMEWCLECHKNPEKYIGPKDKVFDVHWKAEDQKSLGKKLVREYNVRKLTNCSVCHR